MIEVTIDFADEDVPVDVGPDVRNIIGTILEELRQELEGSKAAERIRDGFEVAILGAPNAGKSTLLNAIARRQVALTSEIEGTTRDVIELRVDLHGLPVTFLDTAGLRKSDDVLETAGIDLALKRANAADLRIYLSSDDHPPENICCDVVVAGKSDATGNRGVSGLTGDGVSALLDSISVELRSRVPRQNLAIRERHRLILGQTADHLAGALEKSKQGGEEDMVAEDIRFAASSLLEMIGRVDVEDLLDQIFSRFCIGK